MNMKTLKMVGLVALSLLTMVGGLVFAASFAVEELQSWPKALMEARTVVYGQILLGISLGWASRVWKKRLALVVFLAIGVSVCGFAWALSALPLDRFGLCFWGILLYVLMGGIILAKFIQETFPRYHPLPPKVTGNPSLN